MSIEPHLYKSVNMGLAQRVALLESEVNLRDAYIDLLHQKIKEDVDLGYHFELRMAMRKKPENKRYTQLSDILNGKPIEEMKKLKDSE